MLTRTGTYGWFLVFKRKELKAPGREATLPRRPRPSRAF